MLIRFPGLSPSSLTLGLNLTRAAAALLHNDTLYDSNYVTYDEQEGWWQSLNFSPYSLVFYAISILTTILTIYTFCRMRTLAMLLMVKSASATPLLRELLKNHTRQLKTPLVLAPPTTSPPMPETGKSVMDTLEGWGGNLEGMSKELGDHISTVVVVALILYIIFKMTKGTFAMVKMAIKPNVIPTDSLAPRLVLKVFYKDTCVPIPLSTLIYDLNILAYTSAPALESCTMTTWFASEVDLLWNPPSLILKISNSPIGIPLPIKATIPHLYRLFVYRALRSETKRFALVIVTSKGECIQIPWEPLIQGSPLYLMDTGVDSIVRIKSPGKIHTSLL